jgi:2-desacetyl-2-hydroxyethyl bacteriochlorophyllide A dehydrogenase
MKALRLESVGRLALVDIDVPRPAGDEILVKTGASLICTSDINDLRSNPFGIALPVIMGHEGAGAVAAVGRKVKHFKAGDRIATHPVHPCGECHNCRKGLAHLCGDMGHFGLNMQGTFAEYFVVRQDRARVVPGRMPFEVAALAEPVAVCLEALAQAGLSRRDRLLIIGDGPFGVLLSRLAGSLGLSKIVVAGHHDFRLSKIGKAVGVNLKVVPDALVVLRAEAPSGYDAFILAVGSAGAVEMGIELLAAKGRAVIFSAIAGRTPVDLFKVHVKELEIVGACNDNDMFDSAVEMLGKKGLALGELVTHRLALEDFEKAFTLASTSREEALKVAFVFPKDGLT